MKHVLSTSLVAVALAACATAPEPEVEQTAETYDELAKTLSALQAREDTPESASLWATSSNSLLSMRRAKDVGDLLTVVVNMNDQASLQSSLSRSQDTSQAANMRALLGLPEWANGVLPGTATLSPGIDFDRTQALNGSGTVNRAEQITFTLAARVIGVEPNGNLIIQGYQQTQVSNEVRYLSVSGVIRAQDITRTNTVAYQQIADAQLTYVSEGEATSPVSRRGGEKLLDRIMPF